VTAEDLERVWNDLSGVSGHRPADGMTRRRIMPGSNLHFFLCVLWPAGKWGVLIEGRDIVDGKLPKLTSSRGLTTTIQSVPGEEGNRLSLLIGLEHAEFHDLFATFVTSLLSQLSQVSDEKVAFRHAADYVARWKRMMEGTTQGGLSPEQQRGLLGELYTLQFLMLPALPGMEAVRAWRGPTGGHQDFVHVDVAVEVKTTITKRHSLLKIESEKQLDESVFRALFLVHVRLDEGAKGISLPEMVGDVRSRLKDTPLALNEFNLRLFESGYRDEDSPKYQEKKYVVSSPGVFRVEGDFPRMTEAHLPGGVGDVSYTIIADALGKYSVSDEEFSVELRGENE
jgi:Putative  PD-(D/E)XK family member, (DUF4420)